VSTTGSGRTKLLGLATALFCCSVVVALGMHESDSVSLVRVGGHSALIGNAMIGGHSRGVDGTLEWMPGGCLALRGQDGRVWMLRAPGNSRLTAAGIRLPGVRAIAVGSRVSLRGVKVATSGGTPCRPDAVLFFWSMERL
jgi:hypothetical protein